jgi:VanZ family protein
LQRTARWLLAAAVLLILYGSLFPFEFAPRADLRLSELAASLAFQHASRGDVVANLLLYVPLGLCMAIALPQRWSGAAKIVLTVATGVLLSIAVELVQTMEAARVASLTDVLLNAAGTALGAAAALLYVALGTHVRVPGLLESRPAPVPLGLILLWLCYRLAPFVPTLDWQKFKDSLKPVFLNPSIHAFDVLRFLVGWLVIAHAVRLIWRREFAVLAIVTLAAGTQLGRILVVGKELNPAELVAIAAMFALMPLVQRLPDARRLLFLSLAIAGVVLIQGLAGCRS